MYGIEPWRILRDQDARLYCNVNNLVEVLPLEGEGYSVPVQVPTALFHLLKDFFKLEPAARTAQSIVMYLEELGGKWRFGLVLPGDEVRKDLWEYPDLPPWALPE